MFQIFKDKLYSTFLVILIGICIFRITFGTILPNTLGNQDDGGKPLILTPYLKAGKIHEAQFLSRVRNFTGSSSSKNLNLISYSGFFTINETYNSNIFFWFFPAHFNRENGPVLLWLQGGPGASSLFGLFVENGPFVIDKNKKVDFRETTWSLTHSVLYLDSPVGTGFSFTDNPLGYARCESDVANGVYNALTQFFTLFPEYQFREFYATGESYAGKYVPAVALKIHEENQKSPKIKINLQGLAIGDGWTDPINQINYSQYLYNIGALDSKQRDEITQDELHVRNLILEEKFIEAEERLNDITGSRNRTRLSGKLYKMTGLDFIYNFLYEKEPPEFKYHEKFLEQDFIRKSIHVGNQTFSDGNTVWTFMQKDIVKSEAHLVSKILDLKTYRVLIYQGQLDYCVTVTGVEKYLQELKWHGHDDWNKTNKLIWKVGMDVAGYVKVLDELTFLVVRDAGHMVPFDQPRLSFDMINRFTKNKPFA